MRFFVYAARKVIFLQRLIGLQILYALILGPIARYFSRRMQKKFAFLKEKLLTCVREQREWASLKIPSHLRTIPFLLLTIIKIDEEIKDPHWNQIKKAIFETVLYPLAHKLSYAKRWTKRIQAAEYFLLVVDKKNEPHLLHLLRDTIPFIQCSAAYGAAKLGTSQCVNAIIDEMNKVDRFLRIPFREALLRGNEQGFKHIEKRLESDGDPCTRISCLEVLSDHMNAHVAELARGDLYSTSKNLRLAAIRALGHYPDSESVSSLIPLLKHSEWEIRAIAARSLGYLGEKGTISELSLLLRDQIWWVRMNSAIALKRLGEEGTKVLELQNPHEDRYAYEMAQYVLTLDIYE